MAKQTCPCCDMSYKSNQNLILYDLCNKWLHLKCSNLSKKDFVSLGTTEMPYYCSCCLTEVFPFQSLIDSEFYEIFSNGNFIMKSCKFNNMTFSTESQYCLPKNFNRLNPPKNSLILLHVNTRSLSKNIDKLEELLIDIKSDA